MVRFDNSSGRRIKRVYFYGYVSGEWLRSNLNVTVTVMNLEYGILKRLNVAYPKLTNVASWYFVDVPGSVRDSDFYVLIEPNSRPQAQFNLGYDSSMPNQMSLWATSGALLDWAAGVDKQSTNWMVRVEYE
jgi:hypothetical protein